MNAIDTQDLTKVYKTHFGRSAPPSLDSLSLSVAENEVFGFLGRNGAGKTTTIKILCGLIRPTRGTAQVCGRDVRAREARMLIGYLPENPYFYEYLSPRETLDFYGLLAGLDTAARAREWDQLSEWLDLRDIADQRVREFSKGMRQRLGFAVALVGDPKLLVLDEPMSGLDPLGRRLMRDVILHQRDRGRTIFFSSHVLGDVQQICDRIAVLNSGRLILEGRISDILQRDTREVEVIVSNLPEELVTSLGDSALRARRSEDGHHFIFDNAEAANAAAKAVLESGGTLGEFIPVKESLEDYFVRLDSGEAK